MRLGHTLGAVATAAVLVVGATAYAGSDETTVQRQRIAIDMVVNNSTDTAIFTLDRRTGGVVDKGTVSMGGAAFGDTVRNGMKVSEWVRRPTLNGRRGTVQLVQRFDTNEMQNGVRVGVGTWKIAKGTGTYSGVKGGGRYVAVSMLNGRTLVRQEGWVTGLS